MEKEHHIFRYTAIDSEPQEGIFALGYVTEITYFLFF